MKNINKLERQKLLNNKNVLKLTDKHVVYTKEFKLQATKDHLNGTIAEEIFTSAGIDLSLFKKHYATYALKRWKKKYLELGDSAFEADKRGSGKGSGRPKSSKSLTYEELLAVVEIQQKVIEKVKKMKALASKK